MEGRGAGARMIAGIVQRFGEGIQNCMIEVVAKCRYCIARRYDCARLLQSYCIVRTPISPSENEVGGSTGRGRGAPLGSANPIGRRPPFASSIIGGIWFLIVRKCVDRANAAISAHPPRKPGDVANRHKTG